MLPLFSLFHWCLAYFSVHWTIASRDFVRTILIWFDHKFVFTWQKKRKTDRTIGSSRPLEDGKNVIDNVIRSPKGYRLKCVVLVWIYLALSSIYLSAPACFALLLHPYQVLYSSGSWLVLLRCLEAQEREGIPMFIRWNGLLLMKWNEEDGKEGTV